MDGTVLNVYLEGVSSADDVGLRLPDGRLSALTTAEASVCLSVNQASSIQSLGITCESVTVGHNPTKLV